MKIIKWHNQYIRTINLVNYEFTLGDETNAQVFDNESHAQACIDWFGLFSAEVCDVVA